MRANWALGAVVAVLAGCSKIEAEGGVLVDGERGSGMTCSVAVEGSNVYAVYQGGNDNGGIRFAKSADGGRTWPAADRKVLDAEGFGFVRIVSVGGALHVAYGGRNPSNDVRYARSTNGGADWTIQMFDAGEAGPEVSLAVAGSDVDIVYSFWKGTGAELRYLRSTNQGGSFDAPVRIVTGGSAHEPDVYGSGSDLWVAYWDDKSAVTERFMRSADGGASWSTPADRPGTRIGRIGLSGTTLFIPYRGADGSMFLATSTSSGAGWTDRPATVPDSARGLALSASGDGIYAAYEYLDGDGRSSIGFVVSTDQGQSWPAARLARPFRSSGNGSLLQDSELLVSGSTAALAFHDGSENVFRVASSADQGATW